LQNSPPTPYERFIDFCDDARVNWEQYLQDRDERLRLLKVIEDA